MEDIALIIIILCFNLIGTEQLKDVTVKMNLLLKLKEENVLMRIKKPVVK
jgi:hypothetical protein